MQNKEYVSNKNLLTCLLIVFAIFYFQGIIVISRPKAKCRR